MRGIVVAAMLAVWGTATAAAPLTWTLSRDDDSPIGQVVIDFAAGSVSGTLPGQFGTYSGTSNAYLGTNDSIGGQPVRDFFKLFDPASGNTYVSDYGNGESESFHLNEAAIEFGTIGLPLSPLGGRFAVVIREIQNYDQTYTSCAQYEDLYDPDTGDYIGQGACISTYSTSYYNIGSEDQYYGYLSAAAVAAVPLPATALLLAGALAGLGLARRRVG